MKNAENGGYAVGAFNVYNLEGIEAVIAAAEAEESPAILQVRNALICCFFLEMDGVNHIINHVRCPLMLFFTAVCHERSRVVSSL